MHIELVIAKLITVGLGLLITYKAYKGYRTYGSEPMLYVAIGFLFISIGSVIEGVLFDVVGLSIFLSEPSRLLSSHSGMLVILYSLYGQLPQQANEGGSLHDWPLGTCIDRCSPPALLVGLATTTISFRAYRQQQTRYLRDATLGFGFITLGVLIEGFLYQFTGLTLTQVHVAESVCLVFGLGILLRSFLD